MDTSRISHSSNDGDEDDENLLTLSLKIGSRPSPPSSLRMPAYRYYTVEKQIPLLSSLDSISQPVIPIVQVSPLVIYPNYEPRIPTGLNLSDTAVSREIVSHSVSRPSRARKNPAQSAQQGKTETVPQLFPWSTTQRATVQGLDYLLSHNITTISGQVHCRKCDKMYTIEYDLQQKFREISDFIRENKYSLHDRAPSEWMIPTLPSCESCGSSVKPVVGKKKSINWLFLLLGKMLGCCKLSELKYFCKHTRNHKTGAKDRVLYLTYMGLCKQLDPTGPFDI